MSYEEIIFYLCALVIVYTYAVYPLMIYFLSSYTPKLNSIELGEMRPK